MKANVMTLEGGYIPCTKGNVHIPVREYSCMILCNHVYSCVRYVCCGVDCRPVDDPVCSRKRPKPSVRKSIG